MGKQESEKSEAVSAVEGVVIPPGSLLIKVEHDHECECIAKAPSMGEGREWWIGKLKERIEQYPHETHCLHLKSPVKDVTYLCNRADFEQLQIICRAVTGRINESWMSYMVDSAKKKAV